MQTGQILAELRKTRRLSQLDLALRADVSSRHLSFIETGRSQASSQMLKRLAMELELSCRDTNRLLLSAGYAPAFSETDLDSESMAPVRQALEVMLVNHNPFPAVVLDAQWNVLMANQAQQQLMAMMMQERGPFPQTTNVVELVFHPRGYRPFLANWEEVASFLLRRLHRDQQARPTPALTRLLERLGALADVETLLHRDPPSDRNEPMLALDIHLAGQRLRSFSTLASFGTALDVVMEELCIEHFFPADDATRHWFRKQIQ
ncbi:helix-turn-helix transcriptional regulator [Alcanivorax sp.]|jgi:transcriptional regulator with XRE-family HTH domain|uniref:helix-turn-helix domain-containing protein n=1 Tax=Alcanivorax sp. TaxID=1872427 RepID=UPI00260D745A|nr:helix-turn-helix transcriptional regulator [Alcanivorax sp.]